LLLLNLEGYMQNTKINKTLILGIGNTLLADEGVGVHVANYLNQKKLPDFVEVVDGGTGSFVLLGIMQNADRVILIDATIDGEKPGTIKRLTPKFSKDYPKTLTAHDIGLKDLLDAFYLLGDIPNIILYAISIAPLAEGLSLELSSEVEFAIPEIVDQILKEIE
jgi:hydrogenase maturation protease